jgi:heptosyltransferase-3
MTITKRLERRGKLLLVSGAVALQRTKARPITKLDLSRVRRVLLVRVNFRLGNLLLATPGFAAVRETLPHAEVHVLTTSAYPHLLDDNPDVDRVLTYNRQMLLRPWVLIGLVRQIRARQYDLVIDCSGGESFSGALFACLSGGYWRMGLASSEYRKCFNVAVKPGPEHVHRVDILLALLQSIGICGQSRDMKVILSPEERGWAERRWREWGLSDDRVTVGVNIGARGDKRWPMDHFLSVIRWLDEEWGAQIVMFVGPQEIDRLSAVRGRLPPQVVIDTTSHVRRFAALLARCAVVVTSDTGPMHLAAAVGVPTVSIFLNQNSDVFAPKGEIHRVAYRDNGVDAEGVIDALADLSHSVLPKIASSHLRRRSSP